MRYSIAITETYRKVIAVEANSEREARNRARDAWNNSEVTLNDESFEGVEFYPVDAQPVYQIERKDA